MTAKEYLEQIAFQDRKVQMKRDELKRLRESLDITGLSYENIGAAVGTHKTDTLGDMIAKVLDFENELKQEEMKLAIMRINATTAISNLSSEPQKEILTRWYLLHESLEKIMETTSYSKSRVYSLRKDGITNLPDFESQD